MEQPGFFFCICPDTALLRRYLKKDISGLFDGDSRLPDEQIFWADEGLDSRFWDALTLLGMDGRKRILVVRRAQLLPAEVWKKLSSALAIPRSGILPVFCLEGVWEKGQPKLPAYISKLKCLDFATRKNWVWRSAGLDARGLRSYLQREAKSMGLSMSADVAAVLSEMLIPDAAAVQGVLEQLFLASPDGTVDEVMVRQMTEFTPEAVIFDFIRQLENGKSREVWRTLLREGDGGESLLFPFLSLTAREVRILWQLQAGEKVYVPQYVEAEKRRIASRLGFDGLSRVFDALMKAEFSVKSGQRQPLQAMEELTASLSLEFLAVR